MTDFIAHCSDLTFLRTQWERSLQFGVLVADLSPEATAGDRANISLSLDWLGATVVLTGEVVEAQGVHSVTELDPLSSETIRTLVAAGLAEAEGEGEDLVVPELEPEVEPRAEGEDTLRVAPFTPPTQPPPAAPPAPEQGDAGPVSQPPLSQEPPAVSEGSITESGPAPTGDPDDIATIALAAGPASPSAEALLPSPTQHGDFAKIAWHEVLLHFYTRRATGVLAIEGFRESRWCYLVEGRPVHFLGDQPHPGEFLSDVLVGEGTITMDLWVEALRAQQVTGLPAGEYLVATERLDRTALHEALSKRAQRITRKLMSMNFGSFRFHPYRELVGLFPFAPVPVLEVVLQEQRAALADLKREAVISQAAPFYSLHCRLVLSRLDLLKELPLTPEERHIVEEVLPSNWVLAELVALREMSEQDLLCFVLCLKGLGLVEFVRDEGEGKDRNRAEREVYAAISAMDRKSEFDVLGVHWSSSPEDIKAGHSALVERFSEASYGGLVDTKIAALIVRLEQAADKALDDLRDPDTRRKLRRRLVGADEVRMAAELLQGHAKTARSGGEFAVARACCVRIIDLNPEGREGREVLARARKWLSESKIAEAGAPDEEAMGGVRQDLARLS